MRAALSIAVAVVLLTSAAAAAPPMGPAGGSETVAVASGDDLVPRGTRATLRLKGWLSSADAEPGDRFEATLVEEITVDGEAVVPAGAVFVGRVVEVQRARRPSKGGELTLVVDTLIGEDDAEAPAPGSIVGLDDGEKLEGEDAEAGDAARGGVVGGVVGAILGGAKGALIGIVVGAGGSLAASKGDDVDLPEGTLLRVKFDRDVEVTWTWRPKDS